MAVGPTKSRTVAWFACLVALGACFLYIAALHVPPRERTSQLRPLGRIHRDFHVRESAGQRHEGRHHSNTSVASRCCYTTTFNIRRVEGDFNIAAYKKYSRMGGSSSQVSLSGTTGNDDHPMTAVRVSVEYRRESWWKQLSSVNGRTRTVSNYTNVDWIWDVASSGTNNDTGVPSSRRLRRSRYVQVRRQVMRLLLGGTIALFDELLPTSAGPSADPSSLHHGAVAVRKRIAQHRAIREAFGLPTSACYPPGPSVSGKPWKCDGVEKGRRTATGNDSARKSPRPAPPDLPLFYMDFGTYLGAVRDKDVIPWDTDVDVTFAADAHGVVLERLLSGMTNDASGPSARARRATQQADQQPFVELNLVFVHRHLSPSVDIPFLVVDRATGFYVDVFQSLVLSDAESKLLWRSPLVCNAVNRETKSLPRKPVVPALPLAVFQQQLAVGRHALNVDKNEPWGRNHIGDAETLACDDSLAETCFDVVCAINGTINSDGVRHGTFPTWRSVVSRWRRGRSGPRHEQYVVTNSGLRSPTNKFAHDAASVFPLSEGNRGNRKGSVVEGGSALECGLGFLRPLTPSSTPAHRWWCPGEADTYLSNKYGASWATPSSWEPQENDDGGEESNDIGAELLQQGEGVSLSPGMNGEVDGAPSSQE